MVGIGDGTPVGPGVGAVVGSEPVGLMVGELVGAAVGFELVGMEVGEAVTPRSKQ